MVGQWRRSAATPPPLHPSDEAAAEIFAQQKYFYQPHKNNSPNARFLARREKYLAATVLLRLLYI